MAEQNKLSMATDALRQSTLVCNQPDQPLELYHGSEIQNKEFDPQKSSSKLGSLFTANSKVASKYARPYLYKAHLHQKNPKAILFHEYLQLRDDVQEQQRILASGHDGLIIQNGEDYYYTVFDPDQVEVLSVSTLGPTEVESTGHSG